MYIIGLMYKFVVNIYFDSHVVKGLQYQLKVFKLGQETKQLSPGVNFVCAGTHSRNSQFRDQVNWFGCLADYYFRYLFSTLASPMA